MVPEDPRAPGERAGQSPGSWAPSADRYAALVEAADDAIIVAAFEGGAVVEANPAACELFGLSLEEITRKTVRELHVGADSEIDAVLSEIQARERGWHPGLRAQRKDGSVFWAEIRAKAFLAGGRKQVLCIVRDATHRVERESELARAYQSLEAAQERLVHSGKLAAIGQIAGGVAHEVNNPATFILTNLRTMRDSVTLLRRSVSTLRRELSGVEGLSDDKRGVVDGILESGDMDAVLRETSEMIEDNLAGIERIASIVNDLRIFSRIEQDDAQRVKVNDIVDAACNLAFADIRHRARLVKELSKLPEVTAEPGKLAQVFTNLLLSVAHFIEPGAAQENEIRVSTYAEDGNIVVAIVGTGARRGEDRGPASARSAGRDYGASLGLSLSEELVRLHGGSIQTGDAEGGGTEFVVRLPAAPPASEPAKGRVPSSAPAESSVRRARVLVIDDDAAVLRAYRRMLSFRHDVVLAAGGAEGLDVLTHDENFDVVLCDVMMPQVDGPMVYEALAARAPHLAKRLVFVSGGAFTPRAKEFLGAVENPFLAKPIEPELLEAAIVRARDAHAHASHSASR